MMGLSFPSPTGGIRGNGEVLWTEVTLYLRMSRPAALLDVSKGAKGRTAATKNV